jgi:hypothetical protein
MRISNKKLFIDFKYFLGTIYNVTLAGGNLHPNWYKNKKSRRFVLNSLLLFI